MMRFDVPLIDQAMHPYFRDIQDHVIRLVESIDNLRDLLAAALEAHLLPRRWSRTRSSRSFPPSPPWCSCRRH